MKKIKLIILLLVVVTPIFSITNIYIKKVEIDKSLAKSKWYLIDFAPLNGVRKKRITTNSITEFLKPYIEEAILNYQTLGYRDIDIEYKFEIIEDNQFKVIFKPIAGKMYSVKSCKLIYPNKEIELQLSNKLFPILPKAKSSSLRPLPSSSPA